MEYFAITNWRKRETPLPYVTIEKVNHPLYNDDNTKELFIYGEGWVKIPKKAVIQYADVLPDNYNADDLISAYEKHGYNVLMRLISDNYNPNDCAHHNYSAEITNILKFGKSYDEFVTTIRSLDKDCLNMLKNKYGVYLSYKTLCYDFEGATKSLNAYAENFVTGQNYGINYTGHLCSGNVEISMLFGIPMDAHYNSVTHEPNLIRMILKLSKDFDILDKKFEDETHLLIYLNDLSVKEMIAIIYINDIADRFQLINDFKLIERIKN
jgi:hypothetical protein